MTNYTIYYGTGRPEGNIEHRCFETYNDAKQYAADHARGWGFRVENTDAASERVQEATRAALSRAGMLAEEPKPEREPKTYTTTEGHNHQETTSAAQAMRWHREGRRVTVWGRRSNGDQYHISIPGAVQKKHTADQENRDTCRRIAEEADAYANGEMKRCPDCGEIHQRDWNDVGDVFKCPNCGNVNSVDDWEWLSIYDYLADVLDIEYRIGSDRELRSVCVMVACGGPNIYLDTASKDVELYWWGERARYPLAYETVEALESWAEELYSC